MEYPMRNMQFSILRLSLVVSMVAACVRAYAQEPLNQDEFFPIVLYNHFSRTTLERMFEVIDDSKEHGFNTINAHGKHKSVEPIQAYAQEKGMAISGFCGFLTSKIKPGGGEICAYSPDFETKLHEFVEPYRTQFEDLPTFWMAGIRDEACIRTGSVCHCEHCQGEFKKKHGVELPGEIPPISQPILRRQYVEFYEDHWLRVNRMTRDYMKANNPDLLVGNTFTENNCLGRHVGITTGDLLKWSEPLDWIVADIYPYYYRRHENNIDAIEGAMKRSRLLLAFLRCAGQHHNIPFAWWVGFTSAKEETPKAVRHMSYVAIGQGAQGLVGWGAYFPEVRPVLEYNPELWEDAGKTFREIGKVGSLLRRLKKTSRIALLASETDALFVTERQYLGPFYYDLVPAYDALLKAFGNADLVYDRQIVGGKLKDYEALVLSNVRHISEAAAKGIGEFVNGGGVLISDTVPELDENNTPLETLAEVFGRPEREHRRHGRHHPGAPDTFPALYTSDYGKGKTLLLRFRIGSFYGLPELWKLLRSHLQASGVYPLAVSSNPDIESNYLAGKDCFIIIPVNRSREDGKTEITCFQPPFTPKTARDLVSGEKLQFSWGEKNGRKALSLALNVEGISGRIIGVYP